MSSSSPAGSEQLKDVFTEAQSAMRYNNIYQAIIWDFASTNEYIFDQVNRTVKYYTDMPGIYAVAVPEVMGSFNLDDKTFLWADKNPSFREHLTSKVSAFREQLPEAFQADKFISDIRFNQDLLSYFSYQLNANGFGMERPDQTIIYFALMKIDVFNDSGQLKSSIEPGPHVEIIENDAWIQTVKQMHREKVAVNEKYTKPRNLSGNAASDAIKEVHYKYWLNEDPVYSPGLSWPCSYEESRTRDWKVIRLKKEDRFLVVFSTDGRIGFQHYAYEIQKDAAGQKIIIAEYFRY